MLRRHTNFEVCRPSHSFGRYDTLSVSAVIDLWWPWSLTFDLLTLKLVCIVVRGMDDLSTNNQLCCFWDISFSTYYVWANTCQTDHVTSSPWPLTLEPGAACQTHHVTSRPWPLTLELTALVGDTGLCDTSVYQAWSSGPLFRRYWYYITVWALFGLVILTIWLLNRFTGYLYYGLRPFHSRARSKIRQT